MLNFSKVVSSDVPMQYDRVNKCFISLLAFPFMEILSFLGSLFSCWSAGPETLWHII